MSGVRGRIAGLVGAVVLGLTIVGGAAAQDASPAAGTPTAGVAHPGHIHTGTCDALGDIVAPLPDVTLGGAAASMASPVASPMASPVASPMASPVAGGGGALPAAAVSTTVDLALSDILAAPHVINYHMSAEDIGTYIACGAIGGAPDAQGNLFVGLAEQNNSGISGIAWLQESGAQTVVTVFLTETGGASS